MQNLQYVDKLMAHLKAEGRIEYAREETVTSQRITQKLVDADVIFTRANPVRFHAGDPAHFSHLSPDLKTLSMRFGYRPTRSSLRNNHILAHEAHSLLNYITFGIQRPDEGNSPKYIVMTHPRISGQYDEWTSEYHLGVQMYYCFIPRK